MWRDGAYLPHISLLLGWSSHNLAEMMMSKRVYLAGPEVLLSNAGAIGARKRDICARHGLAGVFPWRRAVRVARQPHAHWWSDRVGGRIVTGQVASATRYTSLTVFERCVGLAAATLLRGTGWSDAHAG